MDIELNCEIGQEVLFKNGLKFLKKQKISDAIDCFQNYIQLDPNNSVCWKNLADAYFERGSYNIAIKAYLKSILLRQTTDDGFYSELKIAYIHRLIHSYEDSINDYQLILLQKNNYVPALIGLSETLLLVAESNFKKNFLTEAEKYCYQIIDLIHSSLKSKKKFAIQYNILSYCYLLMCFNLINLNKIETLDLIQKGIKATNQCLSYNLKSKIYWHNLSLFYWKSYCLTYSIKDFHKSIQCCLNSLKLNRNNFIVWNTLGVISNQNLAISQHCFLKSIKLSGIFSTEIQWNNLGLCYYKDANLSLESFYSSILQAESAFYQSQVQNPSYLNCFIGKALVNEKLNSNDVLDILVHCNSLSYHPISATRFAYFLLLDSELIKKSNYLDLALENLQTYAKFNSNCITLNLLGCLYERIGYKQNAYKLFEKGLQLITNDNYLNKPIENCLTINYLRCAFYFEKPENIKFNLNFLKESWHVNAYLCLAYLRNNQYNKAYKYLIDSMKITENSYIYQLMKQLEYVVLYKINESSLDEKNSDINYLDNYCLRIILLIDYLKLNKPLNDEIINKINMSNVIEMILMTSSDFLHSKEIFPSYSNYSSSWIWQALVNLIDNPNFETNSTHKIQESKRLYRNFINSNNITAKKMIGFHLLLVFYLLETNDEQDNNECFKLMQRIYLLLPFNLKIKNMFKTILRIKNKVINSKNFIQEMNITKNELFVFVLDYFY